ncbi:EAL domain-containing protein [Pectobacterium aroidearum]|uniref:cyclic-guanylate-specific phosphodiesterase n=2 Tax=Pectobacterium TaxID=122277 RepID=A0AAW3SZB7_9GAMM|nr:MULTISPECIES: EAL domain-containing protein [Pectobacterium]ACT15219.1 EAL domain protein [Pectobacterium carotovorum subsp. carotovorum PC1]MBA0205854.1 EAL domain-containing protein [Pectobacterium aroidearum]MBA5200983.1 EAL domain-containing protein [Pectobacterium aroidearum]MBA5204947.1 EAL domain-containing protein [Pectobacterium aroidearum]MBA5229497.1 EAL domain-containing protein [Pectobacterium aroidearum]
MSPRLNKHKINLLQLLVAGILPLLLGLLFTFVESRLMVKRDLESTAQIAMNHAENISAQAWKMVDRLQRFHGQPCNIIGDELQRLGSVFSYFRAIGVIHNTNVYCSSTFGSTLTPISRVIQQPLPETYSERWSLSIAGSDNVKERPALIFVQMPLTGDGAYAMVDAQYLIDLMIAISKIRGYQLTLKMDNGHPIQTGPAITPRIGLFSTSALEIRSSRFPITLNITAPASQEIANWKQAFFTFLPLAIILSLLFTTAIWYWQKRKLLFRDEIRKGIANGEFSVYYQPIYDAESQTCTGVETLLRWRRSNGKWIRPDIFISAAEAESMIIPITRHLFDLVASDIASWQVKPGFHLGLNVAAEHLHHPSFVSDVHRFAEKVASHSLSISLELTERNLISNGPEIIQRLHQLREDGFMITIDDFGTGHCSLSYLQNFPLDCLKIDQGFVSAISSPDEEAPILDAIINLSHRINLQSVAEGVETKQQLMYLQQHGVKYIQGFLYAKPMDNESFLVWLHYNGNKSIESFMMKNEEGKKND